MGGRKEEKRSKQNGVFFPASSVHEAFIPLCECAIRPRPKKQQLQTVSECRALLPRLIPESSATSVLCLVVVDVGWGM